MITLGPLDQELTNEDGEVVDTYETERVTWYALPTAGASLRFEGGGFVGLEGGVVLFESEDESAPIRANLFAGYRF